MAACTSARSKTPASAPYWAWRTICRSRSPSSSASAGVEPRLQRVVDLVRLLEEMLAQAQVVLLAVPGQPSGARRRATSQGSPYGTGEVGRALQGGQEPGPRSRSAWPELANGGVGRPGEAEDRDGRRGRASAATRSGSGRARRGRAARSDGTSPPRGRRVRPPRLIRGLARMGSGTAPGTMSRGQPGSNGRTRRAARPSTCSPSAR